MVWDTVIEDTSSVSEVIQSKGAQLQVNQLPSYSQGTVDNKTTDSITDGVPWSGLSCDLA